MEPFAGAWGADEPSLDFTRRSAPQRSAQAGRVDQRISAVRLRGDGPAAEIASWNPFAASGEAASAEAQTLAATLFTAAVTDPPAYATEPLTIAAGRPIEPMPEERLPADHAVVDTLANEAQHSSTAAPPIRNIVTHALDPVPAITTRPTAERTGAPLASVSALGHFQPSAAPAGALTTANATLPVTVTHAADGHAYTSAVTTYTVGGGVTSVDLYGFARTFDHVRLDYRADGTLATKTLLDTENAAASIVVDYDARGTKMARHEIGLPDRPYHRADILFAEDGSVATLTRSGFASGDVASIAVHFAAPGEIARVEHFRLDGTRLIVGTAHADALAGHGGDVLAGRGGADTFVLLDAGPHALRIADFDRAEGDQLDLSNLLAGPVHFLGGAAFDGSVDAVRFDRIAGGVLVLIDVNGDKHADASVLLSGVHAAQAGDFGF